MVVLLALLNDLPIMMIAYDNAPAASSPVHWDMARVLTISSVLGVFGGIRFRDRVTAGPTSAAACIKRPKTCRQGGLRR